MSFASSSVNPIEIKKFSSQAHQWWDESGAFKALHQLNPLRINFIKTHIQSQFDLKDQTLKGIQILDIGCGGGLLCEPLCRLGAIVTGLDASREAIDVAQAHAMAQSLEIVYKEGTVETLMPESHNQVDVVTAMEIVEHVSNVEDFLEKAISLLKPGGLFFFSTLNRTLRSLALGKIAAEYVLRMVPPGTHTWTQFVKPSEMGRYLRARNVHLLDLKGVVFDPLKRSWVISPSLNINYMGVGRKS